MWFSFQFLFLERFCLLSFVQKVIQDISTSLNLWLRIPSLDDSGDRLPTENIIPLLYNMIDLMSVKVSFPIS